MHRVNNRYKTNIIIPEEEYKHLGPLTRREVEWLSQQVPAARRRWFASIYGTIVSPYARKKYEELLNA